MIWKIKPFHNQYRAELGEIFRTIPGKSRGHLLMTLSTITLSLAYANIRIEEEDSSSSGACRFSLKNPMNQRDLGISMKVYDSAEEALDDAKIFLANAWKLNMEDTAP